MKTFKGQVKMEVLEPANGDMFFSPVLQLYVRLTARMALFGTNTIRDSNELFSIGFRILHALGSFKEMFW